MCIFLDSCVNWTHVCLFDSHTNWTHVYLFLTCIHITHMSITLILYKLDLCLTLRQTETMFINELFIKMTECGINLLVLIVSLWEHILRHFFYTSWALIVIIFFQVIIYPENTKTLSPCPGTKKLNNREMVEMP